jgi:hypothetical protein
MGSPILDFRLSAVSMDERKNFLGIHIQEHELLVQYYQEDMKIIETVV